jgi:DNA (cytosine-5)-methyltransferase 1
MADAKNFRREEWARQDGQQIAGSGSESGLDAAGNNTGDMADADSAAIQRRRRELSQAEGAKAGWGDNGSWGAGAFWSDAIWLTGADGKSRRAKPGVPLLAHGVSARVGRLRAYGNAIVPQLAAEVIGAYMECRP